MLYAVIGGVIGFILGAVLVFLWMRARSRTDAARIDELESRTAAFDQAVADKVRAESALEQLKLSSQRELEFAAKAHGAELDAEKRRAQSELEAERGKSAALLDAEKRRAAAELEAEREKAKSELEAE